MSTGYIAYELLAAYGGLLVAAVAAVGLSAWLVTWRRPGSAWRVPIALPTAGSDAGLIERLTSPVQLPRQLDPDAPRGHRPRAPSAVSTAVA